jgi:hypothetical protein
MRQTASNILFWVPDPEADLKEKGGEKRHERINREVKSEEAGN